MNGRQWVPYEPPPQPDPSVPIDAGELLDHVRSIGFATSTPDRQEEETPMYVTPLADRIAEVVTAQPAALTCTECGTAFTPAPGRTGRPQVACSPECQKRRKSRLWEETKRARRAARGAPTRAREAASTDHVPAAPDPGVPTLTEPVIDPMTEFDPLAESSGQHVTDATEPQVGVVARPGLDVDGAAGWLSQPPQPTVAAPPSAGDNDPVAERVESIAFDGTRTALEVALTIARRDQAVAQELLDTADVVVDYLAEKLRRLGAA